ncbi:MAG TPA: nuclear transport factor 2 family protein [Blastocatellia bacterium]|nr:nuclear transport factor 2 family protein [Blastocatellia bacterium]
MASMISAKDVLDLNERFYRALEQNDLTAMEAIWSHDDHVRCVHPGWAMLVGWEEVRKSWRDIFETDTTMKFVITDISSFSDGNLAWVTCTENITTISEAEMGVAAAQSTNIFRRIDGQWKMVIHHASPVPTTVIDHEDSRIA